MENDLELAAYLTFADPPLSRYNGILSRFPPEILSNIFVMCLPNFNRPGVFSIPRIDEAPLLTAQVCRWWRDVALSTPELWDHLKVISLPDRLKPDLETTKRWLARSGTRSLVLSLSFQHSFEIQEGQGQGVVLSAFLEHSSRWKRIDFLLSGVLSIEVWDAIRSAQAPLLVDADIKVRSNLKNGQIDAISQLLCSSPRLTRLAWSHPLTPPAFDAPWHQLTRLWLHIPLLLPYLLTILDKCTQLSSCMVVTVFKAGWPTSQSKAPGTTTATTLCLPFLTSFDAQIFTDSTVVPELFDAFTFPKLEKLTLTIARGSTSTPSWPQKNYLSFIARSKIALSTLILENIHISDDELIVCLEQSPSLLRLSISGRIIRNVTDKLLKKLTLTPHTEEGSMQMRGLCPLLEGVQFMDGCLWSSDGVLADMVRSRWCPDTLEGLWNVSAEFTLSVDQTHEVDHEILNKLHSEGLVMHVEDIPGQRLAIGWI